MDIYVIILNIMRKYNKDKIHFINHSHNYCRNDVYNILIEMFIIWIYNNKFVTKNKNNNINNNKTKKKEILTYTCVYNV